MYYNILQDSIVERDLGVIIHVSLKFHRDAAANKKANIVLGIIKKSFITVDTGTLPLLYKSMVKTHLECDNVPHYKGDQQLVGKFQTRATKLITNIRHISYDQRLKLLKLPSLMYRRRGDMLETYKIVTK